MTTPTEISSHRETSLHNNNNNNKITCSYITKYGHLKRPKWSVKVIKSGDIESAPVITLNLENV